MNKLKFFLLSCCVLVFTTCDDGEIIITSFDFDEIDLQLCRGSEVGEFVFFKINNEVGETIALNFRDTTYDPLAETRENLNINLEAPENSLVYRKLGTELDADYYCTDIPDAGINVTDELVASSGIVDIRVTIVSEDDDDGLDAELESPNMIDPLDDPDDDRVPNYLDDDPANPAIGNENDRIEEGFDTDGDTIPNFRDQDDDNDNVFTSVELNPNATGETDLTQDTDGDNIPDHLDEDDDGDGILTRNEDINNDGNPRNDDTDGDGDPNYIDPDDDGDGINTIDESKEDTDGDGFPEYLDNDDAEIGQKPVAEDVEVNTVNQFTTTFRTLVFVNNIMFDQTSEAFNEEDFSFGFIDLDETTTTD